MARTKQTARKSTAAFSSIRGGHMASAAAGRPKIKNIKKISSQQEKAQTPGSDNYFSIKFDDQKECQESATKQTPIYCPCGAAFNIFSQIMDKKQFEDFVKEQQKNQAKLRDEVKQALKARLKKNQGVWICEFCCNFNVLPLNTVKVKQQNMTIILQQGKEAQQEFKQPPVLIFCIDTSSSMTTQVETHTRIDCIKRAINDQILRLNYQKSKCRIGLVLFGSQVQLIGPEDQTKLTMNSFVWDSIKQAALKAEQNGLYLSKTVAHRQKLRKKLNDVSCFGCTALGPAVIASLSLAQKNIGSKIIVCTDGMANVGIGTVVNNTINPFYMQAANYAIQKGITIEVLTIKNDGGSSIKNLGPMALKTGGHVVRVDPKSLQGQLSKLIREEVIGREARLQLQCCCGIRFKDKSNQIDKKIGSFTLEYNDILQFQYKELEEIQLFNRLFLDTFKKLCFQLRLKYKGRDARHYLTIFTDCRQLSEKLDESSLNVSQMLSAKLRILSSLISKRQFQQFKEKASQLQRLIKKYQKSNKVTTNKAKLRMDKLIEINENKQNKRDRSREKPTKSEKFSKNRNVNQSDSEDQYLMECQQMKSESLQ